MKERLILLLLLVLSLTARCQESDSFVVWRENSLSWSDFRGDVPFDTNGDVAVISSGPICNYRIAGDTLKYYIICKMVRYRSWHISNSMYGLNHEKGHFDLSEIICRRLRAYFSNPNNFNDEPINTIDQKMDSISNSVYALQSLYDTETDFGSDTLMQTRWNLYIKTQLNILEKYIQTNGSFFYKLPIKKP